jgi:hypothetical protein
MTDYTTQNISVETPCHPQPDVPTFQNDAFSKLRLDTHDQDQPNIKQGLGAVAAEHNVATSKETLRQVPHWWEFDDRFLVTILPALGVAIG